MSHEHVVTYNSKQRVSDLVMSGTPIYIIAEILEISDDTLRKHYSKELKTAKSIAIERIAKTVYQQACEGNEKSQALYLKTQGNDHGWVEKQVIEQTDSKEIGELRNTISELEEKYSKDF